MGANFNGNNSSVNDVMDLMGPIMKYTMKKIETASQRIDMNFIAATILEAVEKAKGYVKEGQSTGKYITYKEILTLTYNNLVSKFDYIGPNKEVSEIVTAIGSIMKYRSENPYVSLVDNQEWKKLKTQLENEIASILLRKKYEAETAPINIRSEVVQMKWNEFKNENIHSISTSSSTRAISEIPDSRNAKIVVERISSPTLTPILIICALILLIAGIMYARYSIKQDKDKHRDRRACYEW